MIPSESVGISSAQLRKTSLLHRFWESNKKWKGKHRLIYATFRLIGDSKEEALEQAGDATGYLFIPIIGAAFVLYGVHYLISGAMKLVFKKPYNYIMYGGSDE